MNSKTLILIVVIISLATIFSVSYVHAQTASSGSTNGTIPLNLTPIFSFSNSTINPSDSYPVYQAHLVETINASTLPPIGDESNLTNARPFLPLDTNASEPEINQSSAMSKSIAIRYLEPLISSDTLKSFLDDFSMTSFPIGVASATSNTLKSLPGGFSGLLEPGGYTPPDPQVATGYNYTMEMVNINAEIWTEQGAIQRNNFTLYSFYGIPTSDSITDPKLFFDIVSNRWFSSILDETTNNVWLAVSYTDDPTYLWAIYKFQTSSLCADQPRIGANDDKFAIVITSYQSGCVGNPLYDQYFIVDKSQLTSHINSPNFNMFTTTNFGLDPARSFSSTSNLYMISNAFGPSNSIQYYTISNKVPLPVGSIINTTLTITPTTKASAPIEPTGSITVKIDNRLQDAVWNQGKLWLAFNDECVPNGDTQGRNCFRLIQINTATNTKSQDFDVGASGNYYFYPGLSMDSLGGLAVVFGYSSSSVYPSIAITGQSTSDSVGTWETPIITIKTGSYPDLTGRYGDYFGVSRDEFNETKLWVIGEYAYSSAGKWSTFISPMQIDDYVPVAIAGSPQTVNGGTIVALDGSQSYDSDGDTLTYSWTQTSGPTVTLINPNSVHPTFTAPYINPGATLQLHLVVNDGLQNSTNLNPSYVNIIVNPSCVPPASGNWDITSSCSLSVSSTAPANVILESGATLTIPTGLSLNIDFVHFHLLVKSGGGVLIQPRGKIP